jgi:hypothetical protein
MKDMGRNINAHGLRVSDPLDLGIHLHSVHVMSQRIGGSRAARSPQVPQAIGTEDVV